MQTLDEYFARPDTPAPRSPVGAMMARILDEQPDLVGDLDRVRETAKEQLSKAARRRKYRILTPGQERRSLDTLKKAA